MNTPSVRVGIIEHRLRAGAAPEVRWNDVMYEISGVAPGSRCSSESFTELIHPDDRAEIARARAEALASSGTWTGPEYRVVRPSDGATRFVRSAAHYVGGDRGAPEYLIEVVRDVTADHLGVAALAASEERMRRLLASTSDGVLLHEPDGTIIFANLKLEQFLGYGPTELNGKHLLLILPSIRHPRLPGILEARMRGESLELDAEYVRKDGSLVWAHVRADPLKDERGKAIGGITTFKDLTAEKAAHEKVARLEQQLHAAQKLEAIGSLAGGIAHDFNNLLSIILTNAMMALSDQPPGSAVTEMLTDIERAGTRAAELTRQLLAFGRKQVLQPKALDVSSLLRELDPMIRRLMREDIELSFSIPSRTVPVMADASQLEQVVLNLSVNARDAMPNGGHLSIELTEIELDADFVALHLGTRTGRHLQLSVSDTGSGMTKEVQERIFEPFFSTKGDKGTGLGLSTVFGIVKQSGGSIWVYSELGKGSTFKVYLPVTEAELAERPVAAVAAGGNETVLLVEDEPGVRKLVRETLSRAGYTVLESAGPGDALLVSQQFGSTVHLLLTDVVMPRMSGGALAKQLTASRPEMKVLFMSGYTDDAIVQQGVLEGTAAFIQKPLLPAALLRRVREVLDAEVRSESARRP
ncbi:MAG: ATP-binding protein [Myxococcaceae bacterium]